MKTKTIGIINDVSILLFEDGEKLTPIKPIAQALGIDWEGQRKKIKEDDVLNSVAVLEKATGADGKQYEMTCLPLQYIFGWLFTINPKNVKPEAQETVKKYRKACYDLLYKHFTAYRDFVIDRSKKTDLHLDSYREAQNGFKLAKEKMDNARKELDEVRKKTFDQWEESGNQIVLELNS